MSSEQLSSWINHWSWSAIWSNTHVSHTGIDGMSWNESLGLRRDWGENTLLLEALAI
jgi:hypothetical protein